MDFNTDLQIKKWTPTKNNEIKRCGTGLYIRGFQSGRKLFQVRITKQWIDIGDYPKTSYTLANELAFAAKRKYKNKEATIDQLKLSMKRTENRESIDQELEKGTVEYASNSGIPTFDEAFREWHRLQVQANTWRHKASVRFPMTAYELHAKPHIGNLSIDKINRPIIKKFMQPLFLSNSETARKLLGYMDRVFETAYDDELIEFNPCPKTTSFTIPKRKVKHAPSLDYSRLPELWTWLDEAPFSDEVKIAMRLAVVTTHRAAVVANMRWDHLDCETGIWTIPEAPIGLSEGYMKSGREFSMKLPKNLLNNLCALPQKSDFVFCLNGKQPINNETLRRNFQKFDDITTHGFRNTFKTWCLNNDVSAFLADRYCDHALQGLDKSYRRDDLFDQRAELAEQYLEYVESAA